MSVTGANNGIGGVQPGVHNSGVENQPTHGTTHGARWGRKLSSFSPKKLFIGGAKKSPKKQKSLPDYKIKKIDVQIKSDGSLSITHAYKKSRDFTASKAFMEEQANILIEKGYSPEWAKDTVKSISKTTKRSSFMIEQGVAKIPFKDQNRKELAQWTEQSFLGKGYSPREAAKRTHELLKKPEANHEQVKKAVSDTPLTPSMEKALTAAKAAQTAYIEQNFKPWALESLKQKGFSP
ncbi:hypothetical protein [Endozoicomonas lisbonensis]